MKAPTQEMGWGFVLLLFVINKKAEKPETQHTPVAQIEVGAGKKLLKSFLLSENY